MKNEDEMLESLESDGIIKRNGNLWEPGPKYEMLSKPLSKGLTEERDIEVKESLLAMSVRFLKRGKKWTLQRVGVDEDVEHIILSTQPVKSVQFVYHPPEKVEGPIVAPRSKTPKPAVPGPHAAKKETNEG